MREGVSTGARQGAGDGDGVDEGARIAGGGRAAPSGLGLRPRLARAAGGGARRAGRRGRPPFGRLPRTEAPPGVRDTCYASRVSIPLRPRLRADLVVEAGDSVVLTDPLFRRRLDLGAIGDVLARLDGRVADDVIAGDARAESVIRTLLLLHFLEDAGGDVRRGLRAHLAGAPLPVVALPDGRFSCQGSGGCCRNYIFGPLTDADIARVSALDLAELGVEGGQFFETRPRPDGRADRYLRTTDDGACIFLGEGARCGIHARHGGAAKPGFCQLFPLVAWPTPAGVRVYDGGECVSFPHSAEHGEPLADQYAAIRALLPSVAGPQPLVMLAPGAPCDPTWWLPVQDRLVAAVREAHPGATLRALAGLVESAALALRRCPLTVNGPAEALAALDGRDAYALPAPTPTDEGRAALAALAGALAQHFAEPLMRGRPAPPFTAEIAGALARVADAAVGGAPLPAEDPATRALWARAFRQRLFGQRALVAGRPRAALLRACLDWLVARAHPGGERAGHTLAARRLDSPWEPVHAILVRAEGSLAAVLDVAEAL